jgi:transposase-like protein
LNVLGAEADAICGAPYGVVSDEVNHRNGYREQRWDTWAGTVSRAAIVCVPLARLPGGAVRA